MGELHEILAANWWLRNPNTGNTNNEYNVNTSGQSNNNNANNSNGFSPDIICKKQHRQLTNNGEVHSMAIAKHADVMQATCKNLIGLLAANTDIESI